MKKNILIFSKKISEALRVLNTSKAKTVFVINNKKQIIGTITDGDIRRGFLKGYDINKNLIFFMKKKFKFIFKKDLKNKQKINKLFSTNDIEQIPILNNQNKIVDIIFSNGNKNLDIINNPFVIMAGGLGKRMLPLTKKIPKPMLKINNKPMIEHIINKAKFFGFYNFYISTNYLRDKIEKYFKDGKKLGVNIKYLKEKKPLGTAGSLSLLNSSKYNGPVIVVNGDLVTDINYESFLKYHRRNKSNLTIATHLEVETKDFGVLETTHKKVTDLSEKPTLKTKINTGMYIVEKKVIKTIKKNSFLNMTDLIKKNIKKSKVFSYPIYENWSDVGNLIELKKIRNLKK